MALYYVFKDGERQHGKYAPPARQGERGAITVWRQRTGITEAEVPDSRLRAEIAPPDSPDGPDPAEMRAREALHDIAARLAAPGEYNGADLGVDLEKILLRHGWATKARRGKVVPVYPEGKSESERQVLAIQRRMYLPGQEWDADLGEHIERILGEPSASGASVRGRRATPKYLQSGTTLGDIANYVETSGESGADLGSGIERILVQDGWVRTGTEGRAIAVYPNRRTVAAKRLEQVLRRMYWPGNEWDADLGPDLERIVGIAVQAKEPEAKYRCWVVVCTGKNRQIKSWGRDLKRDAIRSVKDAVKEHRREGGVQGAEYEANWVWKRGRLEETVF